MNYPRPLKIGRIVQTCLGAFRTPAGGACGEISAPGVRKPAHERTKCTAANSGLLGGPNFHNPWQPDRKGRSATNLALDRDIASHHLTEASAYGEAEAGAAIFARRGGIGLGKILEQLTHLFRRHADAGILYRERNPIAAVLLSMMSIDRNGATLGKLVSVDHEIKQRLPQPHLVGTHRLDLAVAMDGDLIAVLGCQRLDGLDDLSDYRRK